MSQCVERGRSSCKLKGARGAPTLARSSGTDAAGKALEMEWTFRIPRNEYRSNPKMHKALQIDWISELPLPERRS
jgi:hypothetical protein